MLITNNPGFKAANTPETTAPNREILVIDDDPIIRRVIEAYLTDEGYQVAICRDGQAAWERIESNPPAMLITDWNMPGLNGIELTKMVRASCEGHIYILVATSRNTEQDAVEAIEAGADDFLVKPISQQELIARVKRGMTSLAKAQNEEDLSSKDPLTLAFNRRTFERDCLRRMSQARRGSESLSCLLLDIDFFKHINDTYGHSAGDQALRQTAVAIRSHLRPDDSLYRYGGDEFCVLLPLADEDEAMRRALEIQSSINESVVHVGERKFKLRCSGGVAAWREDVRAPGQLIDLADEALLLAKKSGRNQIHCLARLASLSSALTNADSDQLTTVRAEDLMVMSPTTIKRDDSIGHVASRLLQLHVDSLPVVDEQDELIGVVAEQDLFQQAPHRESWKGPIYSLMQTNFVSFEADTTLNVIWDFFRRVAFSRVVIVKQNRPVGTITRSMLLRWATSCYFDEHHLLGDATRENSELDVEEITSDIIEQMRELQQFVSQNSQEDTVPALVCCATRLQEQGDALLAHTRGSTAAARQANAADASIGSCH